jgi:hypothetical protein
MVTMMTPGMTCQSQPQRGLVLVGGTLRNGTVHNGANRSKHVNRIRGNPYRVEEFIARRYPGCASRPWALMSNPYRVEERNDANRGLRLAP